MSGSPPFLVFAAPRSRSFWLSRYLSFGGWDCGHDELRRMRSLDDVKRWLSQPWTGSVETAAAPFWRMAMEYRPDLRVVVLRRAPEQVTESWFRAGGDGDPAEMLLRMRRLDRKLQQIAHRWPGALSVTFDGLREQAICAAVTTHCLGVPHDPAWWASMSPLNMQASMPALLRYIAAFGPAIEKLRGHARSRSLSTLARRPVIEPAGMTFQLEPFDKWFADAAPLFEQHMVATDQAVEDYTRKNITMLRHLSQLGFLHIVTARSNGRMFGYLMTVISPSLDDPTMISAQHMPIFAAPEVPGLGKKLLRAAQTDLAARGVGEAFSRAGIRGSGPRLGALYRRLGAEPLGEMYRFDLRRAA